MVKFSYAFFMINRPKSFLSCTLNRLDYNIIYIYVKNSVCMNNYEIQHSILMIK